MVPPLRRGDGPELIPADGKRLGAGALTPALSQGERGWIPAHAGIAEMYRAGGGIEKTGLSL